MDEAVKKQNDSKQPVPSVGTANKEAGVSAPYIESAEPQLNLPEDVEKAGVQKVETAVPEHKDIGLVPSAESAKPNLTSPAAEFDMSEEEARDIIKKEAANNFDIKEQTEGVYGMPSIVGLAIIKLKNILRLKFLRRE